MDDSVQPATNLDSPPNESAQRLRRASLHDQLVSTVRSMIVEGRVPPATRIPEAALCEQLGVSRTPLREALKVLASEGLVESRPNRGMLTTPVTVQTTQDLFQVMRQLEPLVGRSAAENASDETIAELMAMHQRLRGLHRRRRRADYFRLNQQIHLNIAAATGNAVLIQTYTGLLEKVRRARYLANTSTARWDESMEEHEHFMEALENRQADLLAERLTRHVDLTGEAVIAALQELE